MKRASLEARFHLVAGACALFAVIIGVGLQWLTGTWWLALIVAALASLVVTLLVTRRFTRPINRTLEALTNGVASFKDGDFSVSLGSDRNDELGELVEAYNIVGDVLRSERQDLFQRELLLDTVIQATPVALVLTDPHRRIVYSNGAARKLFRDGRRLEGLEFPQMLEDDQPEFLAALQAGGEGLFTLPGDNEDEVYFLSQREFQLNARPHALYLFKQLTHELNRQEVATWKKVIRVISHELNNSLAPISSLAHSGRELLRRDETGRLDSIFGTIEERSLRLKEFIEGYARFARLPAPRPETVEWCGFFDALQDLSTFTLAGEPPAGTGFFDAAQVQHVMLNLLKNASESGSEESAITVMLERSRGRDRIVVRDHGDGMSDNVLRNALLPFYSTKKSGSGLGLPLCREIVEAHGGRLSLANHPGGGLEVSFWLPHPGKEVGAGR